MSHRAMHSLNIKSWLFLATFWLLAIAFLPSKVQSDAGVQAPPPPKRVRFASTVHVDNVPVMKSEFSSEMAAGPAAPQQQPQQHPQPQMHQMTHMQMQMPMSPQHMPMPQQMSMHMQTPMHMPMQMPMSPQMPMASSSYHQMATMGGAMGGGGGGGFSHQQHQQMTTSMGGGFTMGWGGGGGYQQQFRQKTSFKMTPAYHPAPPPPQPLMPHPQLIPDHPAPVAPAAPPAIPDDGILPIDKPTLLHEATAAYLASCRETKALVTMTAEQRHDLVVHSKKMPVDLATQEFVVAVDMLCDFWGMNYAQEDCFRMPARPQWQFTPQWHRAIELYGIDLNDNSYGNHKDRALFCKIMQNLDAAELKQSRSVPTDEMKTQLINLMLAEHKKARNMPPAYPLGIFVISMQPTHIYTDLQVVSSAFWNMVPFVNHFHELYTKQTPDACKVVTTDQTVFAYYDKLVNGIKVDHQLPEEVFNGAIKSIKQAIAHIPLDLTGDKLSAENCSYHLFLIRPVFELFLALATAIYNWLQHWGYQHFHHFCSGWGGCDQLPTDVIQYRNMVMENIKFVRAWFQSRDHGLIKEDFAEFERNYINNRFQVLIPNPPQPQKFKMKNTVTMGNGKYKMTHTMDGGYSGRTMTTKMSHKTFGPYGPTMKQKTKINHGAFGMPMPFDASHHFNAASSMNIGGGMGGGHFSAASMNVGGGGGGGPHPYQQHSMMNAMMGGAGAHGAMFGGQTPVDYEQEHLSVPNGFGGYSTTDKVRCRYANGTEMRAEIHMEYGPDC